ncbi:MAG: ribonuclease E/G [Butyrivibrio sp.]|nr:ribonuclease E/G [Butyrivibrio sp.]MBR1642455.1 ribonuclease E/G [Butyrivibrio sp.]
MADIFVSEYKNYPVVSVYIDDKLSFLSLVRESDLGSIYLCRVDNIIDNLQAAFVRFADGQIGYVPFKSILPSCVVNRNIKSAKDIRQGDEIILQVDTEAIKQKKAKLTSNISVSGKYSVVTLGRSGVGASLKLSDDIRNSMISEIKKEYKNLLEKCDLFLGDAGFGIIIRTEAGDLDPDNAISEILSDIEASLSELSQILDEGRKRSLYSCIKKSKLGDVNEHITKAKNFLKSRNIDEFQIINDSVVHSIKQDIEKLLSNKVWLKSGGFLIIEQLESFNAIDVNSGKAIDKKKDSISKINYEAADEIFRQIRLRNLSGMILIDFINMKSSEDTEKLCSYVRALARKEPVHTEFIDITGLGIIELTRSKNDKTLKEVLQNTINAVDKP